VNFLLPPPFPVFFFFIYREKKTVFFFQMLNKTSVFDFLFKNEQYNDVSIKKKINHFNVKNQSCSKKNF